MAIVVSTTWTTIIQKPVTKLQDDNVLADESIFLSFASDEELAKFRIAQDRMIVIRPKTLPPDAGCQAGGGTAILRLDPVITVSVWNRVWTDQAGEDAQWMHNSSLGIAALQTSVMSSLEQYMPTDSAGDYLLIQPMRLMPGGWSFPVKRVGEWGVSTSEWFFPFWHS